MIVVILVSLVVVQFNNFKYEYYRTRDLLEDRRVAWYEIPLTLKNKIENGHPDIVESKYLFSTIISIGKNINRSNSDTMVSGKFSPDDNERILWEYYNDLSEKARKLPSSIKEKNTDEIDILIKELEYLLIQTIEVYEEVDSEVRYIHSKNFLEFDPFKVDSQYINELYVEKLKERELINSQR